MSNPHYATSGSPVSRSRGRSDVMRDEFSLIENAFDSVEQELQERVTVVDPTSSGALAHAGTATFTGQVNVPTPALADDSTKAANTTWVRAILGTVGGGGGGGDPLPPKVGKEGALLATDGTTNYWQGGGVAAVSFALLQQGII